VVASLGEAADNIGGARLARTLQQLQDRTNGVPLPVGLQATRIRSWFQAGDPWPCISPERLALLERLEQEFFPLESEETGTKVGIGVATGLDEVYITTDPHLVEESRLLPLALVGHATNTWD
jgi:hypothetical protein